MQCNDCFYDYIVRCLENLYVNAQLAPATTFTWIITDKFDHQYQGTFTTDAAGFWVIPVEDLPAGLLTEFSGEFRLQVLDAGCKPIKFKIAQEYDCITFGVRGGTRIKDTLGCEFTCMGIDGGGAQTAVFPFTNADTVTIPWTTLLAQLYGSNPITQVFHETSPGVYQEANVSIEHIGGVYGITSIEINNGGPATGYVLIS